MAYQPGSYYKQHFIFARQPDNVSGNLNYLGALAVGEFANFQNIGIVFRVSDNPMFRKPEML